MAPARKTEQPNAASRLPRHLPGIELLFADIMLFSSECCRLIRVRPIPGFTRHRPASRLFPASIESLHQPFAKTSPSVRFLGLPPFQMRRRWPFRAAPLMHAQLHSDVPAALRSTLQCKRDIWCGREDSNFHGFYPTATSTLRVYQFRHDRTPDPSRCRDRLARM